MRFMVIVKASQQSESGAMPTAEELREMNRFNESLIKAGVMLAGEGLLASSRGARIRFDGKKTTVIDGPFAETKELVAGYWLVEVESLAKCVELFKRAPFQEGELEIRPLAEEADFGDVVREAPEVFAAERAFRERQARH